MSTEIHNTVYSIVFSYGRVFENPLQKILVNSYPNKSNYKRNDKIKINRKQYYVRYCYYSILNKDVTLNIIVHDKKLGFWDDGQPNELVWLK